MSPVKHIDRIVSDYKMTFGENLKILHPLPRVNEVADDVDDLPGHERDE